jgi:outer membrane protein W
LKERFLRCLMHNVVTFALAANRAVFFPQGVFMKKIAVAALLTAMMGAASAQAYIGGVIGRSHLNMECADYNLGCDKSDTGTKLYAGYKFNPLIALEAAYVDFGKGTRGFTDNSFGDIHDSFEASGVLVAAAFRYAAHPQLSLVGRVGLSFLKTKFNQTAPDVGGTYSASDDSVKPYIGVGIEFALNKNLRLTADADFTTAEVDNNKGSVRLLGVGLQYGF